MNARVPPPLTWHIYYIIVDSLGPMVFACILNQSKGHWFLCDALNFAILMSLKFKDEIDSTTFNNLMEEDVNVVFELSCLASNIKKKLLGFWILLFPSLKNMKKTNPMICFL
jgi:hypothetical protein